MRHISESIGTGVIILLINYNFASGEDLDGSLDTNELMQLIHMDNDVENNDDNEDYEEVDTSSSSLLSDMRFKIKTRDGALQTENFVAKDR